MSKSFGGTLRKILALEVRKETPRENPTIPIRRKLCEAGELLLLWTFVALFCYF